jgi:hypothetical protein
MESGNNLLDLTHGFGDFHVCVCLHAVQPLLVGASLNGAFAVRAAWVLHRSSVSLSREASDHVCGDCGFRWFWWVLCGMCVMIVRQSVIFQRESRSVGFRF